MEMIDTAVKREDSINQITSDYSPLLNLERESRADLESQEDVSAAEDRRSPSSRLQSPGSLSSSSPLSCGGSVCDRSPDCDFWRPPSPSSSPGLFKNDFIKTEK